MNMSQLTKLSERFVIDNSPTILTGLGVAGVVATAFLTGKASIKADKIIRWERDFQYDKAVEKDPMIDRRDIQLEPKEKLNLVWREFVPPVLMGAATIAAIIGANQIGNRRTAALAAAYTLSEKASNEFRAKVKEKIGEKKVAEIKDEIAQERIDATPNAELIVVGDGKVKCLELYTGRYFMIRSVEDIKAAQNKINYDLNNQGPASLSDFYDLLDIPHTTFSDSVGWRGDKQLEIHIGGGLDEHNKPCVTFDYLVEPVRTTFR